MFSFDDLLSDGFEFLNATEHTRYKAEDVFLGNYELGYVTFLMLVTYDLILRNLLVHKLQIQHI